MGVLGIFLFLWGTIVVWQNWPKEFGVTHIQYMYQTGPQTYTGKCVFSIWIHRYGVCCVIFFNV